jgi:hypothetical protein
LPGEPVTTATTSRDEKSANGCTDTVAEESRADVCTSSTVPRGTPAT